MKKKANNLLSPVDSPWVSCNATKAEWELAVKLQEAFYQGEKTTAWKLGYTKWDIKKASRMVAKNPRLSLVEALKMIGAIVVPKPASWRSGK